MPFLTILSYNYYPSANSVTIKMYFSVSFTSNKRRIFGCLISLSISSYFCILSISFLVFIFFFYNILIATFYPVGMCVPSRTLPNVPLPITFPILKFPINFSSSLLLICFILFYYGLNRKNRIEKENLLISYYN